MNRGVEKVVFISTENGIKKKKKGNFQVFSWAFKECETRLLLTGDPELCSTLTCTLLTTAALREP